MPWSGGSFTRTNGTYTGSTVWNSDYTANIKITHAHHDTHDHDLADGIDDCLNKNGQNSPTANIDWGGFKITGLGAGTASTDSAQYGQTITAAAIDSSSKVLTLTRSAGDVTVDLTPITVAGDTSDFARKSTDNTFTGTNTFTDDVGTGGRITQTYDTDASWRLVATSESLYTIAPDVGGGPTFNFKNLSGVGSIVINSGSDQWRVWHEGNFDPTGLLRAGTAETITANWAFTGSSLQLPAQAVLTGSGYSWAFTAPSSTSLQFTSSGGSFFKIVPDTTHTSKLNIDGNVYWNSANFSIVDAAPVNPAGATNDVAIVTSGTDKGVWVKLTGDGWTKIV